MTIENYIDLIRSSITEGKSYDEYKNLFFQYIDFLEDVLKNNPKNIKAVCQLAIAYMEAREPAERSVELMENALANYRDSLNNDEITELLNNLAFFYEEDMGVPERGKALLENAVELDTKFPNTYNALGIQYIAENNNGMALKMFKRAVALSDDYKYKNNYAVALYQTGQIDEAAGIFHNISKEWKDNQTSEKAYYSYAMIKSLDGDTAVGIEIADNLYSKLDTYEDADVNSYKIADLYYVCNEYEKCIELYNHEGLYHSADWLGIYFYCLKALGLKQELNHVFNEIIAQINKNIEEEQLDKDEDWGKDERKEYIKDLKKDIKYITKLYNSIQHKGYKPIANFKPELIYGCYLIDCPRHDF